MWAAFEKTLVWWESRCLYVSVQEILVCVWVCQYGYMGRYSGQRPVVGLVKAFQKWSRKGKL